VSNDSVQVSNQVLQCVVVGSRQVIDKILKACQSLLFILFPSSGNKIIMNSSRNERVRQLLEEFLQKAGNGVDATIVCEVVVTFVHLCTQVFDQSCGARYPGELECIYTARSVI